MHENHETRKRKANSYRSNTTLRHLKHYATKQHVEMCCNTCSNSKPTSVLHSV